MSLRGAKRRGNLKVGGMASRGEAREHETRKDANNGTHRAGYAAPICFVTDLFRFGFVLFLPYFVPG